MAVGLAPLVSPSLDKRGQVEVGGLEFDGVGMAGARTESG